MAGRTLRCVALAFRTYEPEKVPTGEELSNWVLPEDGLILLAIVGIKVRTNLIYLCLFLLYLEISQIYISFWFSFRTTTDLLWPAILFVVFLIELFENVHRIHVDQESEIQFSCVRMLVSRCFFCSILLKKAHCTNSRS